MHILCDWGDIYVSQGWFFNPWGLTWVKSEYNDGDFWGVIDLYFRLSRKVKCGFLMGDLMANLFVTVRGLNWGLFRSDFEFSWRWVWEELKMIIRWSTWNLGLTTEGLIDDFKVFLITLFIFVIVSHTDRCLQSDWTVKLNYHWFA